MIQVLVIGCFLTLTWAQGNALDDNYHYDDTFREIIIQDHEELTMMSHLPWIHQDLRHDLPVVNI